MKKSRHGFTLVELLVVIGIITLLISMLLPALNRARQSARVVQCMSNMRQLGLACVNYGNSFKGTIPLVRQDWFIVPYVSNMHDNWGTLLLDGKYIATDDVFYCPEYEQPVWNHPTLNDRQYSTYWGYFSYTMNLACSYDWAANIYRANKFTDVRSSAEKILLVEGTLAENNNVGYFMAYPWYSSNPGIAWPRHGRLEKCNVLWMDGHVTTVRNTTPGIASGIYGQGALTTMNSSPDYWRIR